HRPPRRAHRPPRRPHRPKQGAPTVTEHAEWSEAEAGATAAGHAVTPADAADAARLVAFGLQPKLQPARDQEYADLLRRYRDDPRPAGPRWPRASPVASPPASGWWCGRCPPARAWP